MTHSEAGLHPLYQKAHRNDPFPVYARMRGEGPVELVTEPRGIRHWVITRYDEARAALADRRLSRDPRNMWEVMRLTELYDEGEEDSEPHMLNADPPDHTRLRQLANKAFTARRVERLRPRIQRITDELLASIDVTAQVDFMSTFAAPMPIKVICELLGVPYQDAVSFTNWVLAALTPTYVKGERIAPYEANGLLRQYFIDLVARKRAELKPGSGHEEEQADLLSALIVAGDSGDVFTEKEVVSTAGLLLIAGYKTTVNLIGNGMLALLQNPAELERLRRDPALMPSAVEELARYDGPVERAMLRVATEPVTIGDVTIPAGGLVTIANAAANRDERRFTGGESLDVGRGDRNHLAFGYGIHHCIGAPLSRLETEIAFTSLLREFPEMTLACPVEKLEYRETGVLRGLAELPMWFTRRESVAGG
ncbi:cytochrome P450 family protein [Amycolatopsis vastitatis]|uniref:Cytochrome P450 n=1 Tax=Amycolatopsis vastitatis TaxID=1905142 RepID=A0A229T3X1_9PSEU|nr:cytochrome P450 [Amycolatopsis vastitatis]OXM65902.1 cytochrome P450 [Amycolatopsis vastitatis]